MSFPRTLLFSCGVTVFLLLALPIFTPILLLSALFDRPVLIGALSVAAIFLQLPYTGAAADRSAVAAAVSLFFGVALPLAGRLLAPPRAPRGSRASLAAPFPAALLHAAPGVAASLCLALLPERPIPAPLAAACACAPLAMFLSTTRAWFCRATLDGAADAQAVVFAGALAGSGVCAAFSSSREGLAVVEFRVEGRALPPGGAPPPIVLLHGYGSGAALYFRQAAALARGHGGAVFAVDWAGMGCSARGAWPVAGGGGGGARVTAAEDALLLPLEAWMAEAGIRSAFFAAHSLGGYLATALWLRNPERVAGLVLLSPAGFAGLGEEVPLPVLARPAAALAAPAAAAAPGAGTAPAADPPPGARAPAAAPPRRVRVPRCLFAALGHCWDAGVTPMALMRYLGPCGAPCVRGSLRGRSSRWLLEAPIPPDTLAALSDWLFHALCAPPAGEAALSALLAPGAWARAPLIPRLRAALRAGALKPVPVVWLYGDYDWMSYDAGKEAAALLRDAGWRSARAVQVPRSGHHLYLEAHSAVNKEILEAFAPPPGDGGSR